MIVIGWTLLRSVEAVWITQILWLFWQSRPVIVSALTAPLWRRLSLDGDDLE